MKQIISIALLILLPISIYSQNMEKIYKDGIEKHLREGKCEQAEIVYRAGTKNKVIEVDKNIESRIAECKGSTISTKTNILYQSHNGHEYVDLSLPSGIKWATCNVGANSPEEYGDYFAWGETKPKTTYNWDTYKYCNGSYKTLTKYCADSDYGTVDYKRTLDLKDDAAHVNWGGKWRMPTKEEQDELRDTNNCTWEWTTRNGVNGYKVTSVKNGNSIFLPAAGFRDSSNLKFAGDNGDYWSSSLDTRNRAYGLVFKSSFVYRFNDCRYFGDPVRPVCDSTINNSSNYTNNQSYVSQDYVENAKNLNMKMVYVEGGTFTMGATEEQSGEADNDETPTHRVTLDSYYIGACEVTQAQWRAVMGSNPSDFTGDNNPVENVSWNEAMDFCRKLSNLTGRTYTLPTEAQWEYAARGGKKSKSNKYSGSYAIDAVAWYTSNSGSKTHPVGQKRANELGIYDMSGNVWEWCSDWYGSYSSSYQTNPIGPLSGKYRVLRGGSWGNDASYCRVSFRNYNTPSFVYYYSGFRVVCFP